MSNVPEDGSLMDLVGVLDELIQAVSAFPKTVVAAIRGNVSGGSGLEVIMACDYRIIMSSSTIGGSGPSGGSSGSIVLENGPRRRLKKDFPMKRLLNGESITAIEAKNIGLVDELIDASDDILLSVATQVACKHGKRLHHARQSKVRRLLYYIPEQFLIFRASELFNLIRDFPDSQASLDELKIVLDLTCQHDYVIGSIKKQLAERLLIPGAHTEDVLEMYLRTFKVISFLFPEKSMDVFVRIATPVIQHLQKRPDSVKCIVSTLLDQEREPSIDEEQEETIRGNDTISLLIGVYGGQESFLDEYKEMLAGRLVSIGSFEIDRELASLDLMKSKFGEAALGHCSVMIKDIMESRRLNNKIRAQLKSGPARSNISMVVKSGHFWPSVASGADIDDEGVQGNGVESFSFLPQETVSMMKEFERIYTDLKPTQRIEWRKAEGVMTISVQLRNGREAEFRLSPMYVEVLSLFEKISLPSSGSAPVSTLATPIVGTASLGLTLEAIAASVKMSVDAVRPVVLFWVSKGILREVEINKFSLNE